MKDIAIVTGASSGIGRAYVRLLSEDKSSFEQIWIAARREDKLNELKSELKDDRIVPVVLDLSEPSAVSDIASRLSSDEYNVKLLINCAGLGKRALFEEQSVEALGATLDVNCRALTLLTRVCIPYMSKGSGIINVASSAAFLPQPTFTVYAASKSYVTSFSRALNVELKSSGITVTAVCPGPVNTEFQVNATDGKSSEFTGFRKFIVADPDKLAKASLKAHKSGRCLYVYGISQKLLHLVSKIVPVSLMLMFMKVNKEKK